MEISTDILYIVFIILSVTVSTSLILFYRRFHSKKDTSFQEYQNQIQDLETTIQQSQLMIQEHQTTIQGLQYQLKQKATRSWLAGQNSANGGVAEFLGYLGLAITQKFDVLCMMASTSKKPSVDAIGFNDDMITFLEFKKSGADVTLRENKVKKLITEGKVDYKIVDVNLPNNLTEVRNVKREVNECHIQN